MSEVLKDKQQKLIDRLMDDPILFVKENGIDEMIKAEFDFTHLRSMVCRIYDLNESQLLEMSNANGGTLGKMNKKDTDARMKLYKKKVDRQKSGKQYYRIYAEGDSWFQFPRFLKDIIDWLNDHDDFLIASEAYGGDWITNIVYEEQYVQGLSTYPPDFFLISGGGNDLVGNHRLGVMVDKQAKINTKKYSSVDQINSSILSTSEKQMIIKAQDHLNKEFYALLAVFQLQYTVLFNKLYGTKSKHKEIVTITQGYDYPIPSPKRRGSLKTPLQPLINSFLDTGNWLFTPLMIKGILDEYTQRSIMFTMIFEFNEMLSSFTKVPDYKVFHVDNRGLTQSHDDWYDELHLKRYMYKRVANAYEYIIRNHRSLGDRRIIRTKDL